MKWWLLGQILILQVDPSEYEMILSYQENRLTIEEHMQAHDGLAATSMMFSYRDEKGFPENYPYYLMDGGFWDEQRRHYGALKKRMNAFIYTSDTLGIANIDEAVSGFKMTKAFRIINDGKIVWANSPKWSMALMGSDKEGMIYFIAFKGPYTTGQIGQILLDELDLDKLVFMEGGSEVGLTIANGPKLWGTWEDGVSESMDNDGFWNVPYAFVLKKK